MVEYRNKRMVFQPLPIRREIALFWLWLAGAVTGGLGLTTLEVLFNKRMDRFS